MSAEQPEANTGTHMTGHEDSIQRHAEETARALAMGGDRKLQRRHDQGLWNARERIKYLLDSGSLEEIGLYATSLRHEDSERSPGDAKVCGYGKIDGRSVAIVSNDFTVLGASSSPINRAKIRHLKEISASRGLPMVFLGESSGARLPDTQGTGMAGLGYPNQYRRQRETPWVSAVLGYAYGSSTLYACMADFNVVRKGSIMSLSSPRLLQLATGEQVDAETLGGWRLHAETTGLADMVVDTDREALDAVRRFLSYLPSHQNEAPPVVPLDQEIPDIAETMLDVIPASPGKVYNVLDVLNLVVDPGSLFEIQALFARNVVTALTRIDGRTVGVIANNPWYKGGALDANGSAKVTGFLVLCDSFNIPVVFFVDQPGFLIGVDQERRGLAGKVINWMNALTLCTVPKISIIMRKSYGQAYLNMGGSGNTDEIAAWWTADISFMDPRAAVAVAYNLDAQEDPDGYANALATMSPGGSAYDMARVMGIHSVIDPRETRRYLKRTLEYHRLRLMGGLSQHLLSGWPTSF